ncbi:hypothetical protein [Polyangium aurulentum]|uniref:hypothetical protein n=1 Tax=Polyangium aurulentum TaxID=2567896 RepID=UPI00146EFA5A|nr:hypothetical protein [Polyangium aurulentum]UQA56001.1 hypothetical protein E8A73_032385 [Polyangium aurulentum]
MSHELSQMKRAQSLRALVAAAVVACAVGVYLLLSFADQPSAMQPAADRGASGRRF